MTQSLLLSATSMLRASRAYISRLRQPHSARAHKASDVGATIDVSGADAVRMDVNCLIKRLRKPLCVKACVLLMQTRDESMVPLSINCWPSVSGGESYVNIEYEATADFDLQNVVISIPLPALSQAPRVPQAWPFQQFMLQPLVQKFYTGSCATLVPYIRLRMFDYISVV